MSMTKIAETTFTASMIREGSWGANDVGTHQSTMTLYGTTVPGHAFIEWDIPSLDEVVEIGLNFDVQHNLLDYDGTFSLPREAVALLRANGFTVGTDFE